MVAVAGLDDIDGFEEEVEPDGLDADGVGRAFVDPLDAAGTRDGPADQGTHKMMCQSGV